MITFYLYLYRPNRAFLGTLTAINMEAAVMLANAIYGSGVLVHSDPITEGLHLAA